MPKAILIVEDNELNMKLFQDLLVANGYRTDRAEDIGPFGALVAGRPRARATSGPSACELILLADAGFILPPQLYLDAFREPRPDLRQFGGEVFFKSLDGQLVLRVVARPRRDPWRSRAPSTRARPWSRRARWRTSQRATAPGPCAASARRRRPPGPGRPQQPPASARR